MGVAESQISPFLNSTIRIIGIFWGHDGFFKVETSEGIVTDPWGTISRIRIVLRWWYKALTVLWVQRSAKSNLDTMCGLTYEMRPSSEAHDQLGAVYALYLFARGSTACHISAAGIWLLQIPARYEEFGS